MSTRLDPPVGLRQASMADAAELLRVLGWLADPTCEDCGGTGDVDPAPDRVRPCRCVLDTQVKTG